MEYKLVGDHPEILEGGRPVAPGEEIELTDEEMQLPVNASLIAQGKLMALDEEALAVEDGLDATSEARTFASDNQVDLHEVSGSGQNGRILKSDIEAIVKQREAE